MKYAKWYFAHLFGDFSNGRHGGSVKIVIVLSSFYEQMVLDIPLHLLPGRHEMVIPSIHFVFSSTPRCICKNESQRRSIREIPLPTSFAAAS